MADGHVNPDITTDIHRNDSYETIFTELGNGKFVPRSIFVDLDPSVCNGRVGSWNLS
jgi:tubulin alpha